MKITPKDMARFMAKVEQNGPMPGEYTGLTTPCQIWTRGGHRNGYGQFWLDGTNQSAHVIAFAIAHGHRAKHQVLHRCDRKLCVNPKHLFDGTHADNMADRQAKGRQAHAGPKNPACGERNHLHKLTAAQVAEIRAKYKPREYPQRRLAREYGISQSSMGAMLRGETWRSVGKQI